MLVIGRHIYRIIFENVFCPEFAKEINTKERLQLCEHSKLCSLEIGLSKVILWNIFYLKYLTVHSITLDNQQRYLKKYYSPASLDVQVGTLICTSTDRELGSKG